MQGVLANNQITFQINSFRIRRFEYIQWDFNNQDSARLQVKYTLGYTNEEGLFTESPLPYHTVDLELLNVGTDKQLRTFLIESGTSGEADLHQFDYHDLLRLCATDIKAKFNISLAAD